ncbi:MAG: hypothetical protein COA94_08610 [Rickettsiales bacterium]|nr:MAG: hypothetical protein COA94_08610 [Rickettsiales bacterium]
MTPRDLDAAVPLFPVKPAEDEDSDVRETKLHRLGYLLKYFARNFLSDKIVIFLLVMITIAFIAIIVCS